VNNDDPKLQALAASAKEARPTNDPRYQRDGGRRWRVFRSDPRPHQGRDPLPHPGCVAGLVGGQNAGGDDRGPIILQNPADRFEPSAPQLSTLDCRAGRTAASAPVAPLASLGTSAAGPTRKAVKAAPGQTILAKCKIFLFAGGTGERGSRRGTGGPIRSI